MLSRTANRSNWLATLFCLILASDVVASDVRDKLPTNGPLWGKTSGGSLCGLYAACTSLRLIGLDAEPKDFMAARYIGNCQGSTPNEIAQLVRDAGGGAIVANKLSGFDLKVAGCPVIANVRATPSASRFNHWVTVVVEKDKGNVTVYDGPANRVEMELAEFLGIWSGIGVLVSAEDSRPLRSVWLGRLGIIQSVIIAGCFIGTFGLRTLRMRINSSARQMLAITAGTVSLAIVGNLLFGDLSCHARGVAAAAAPSQSHSFKECSLEEMLTASRDKEVLLIDARLERDYETGTIEGAVNIPVTGSPWEIRDYVGGLPRNTPIMVFCHSSRCGFDEEVAGQLLGMEFRNVTVSQEGYVEYQARLASNAQRPSAE